MTTALPAFRVRVCVKGMTTKRRPDWLRHVREKVLIWQKIWQPTFGQFAWQKDSSPPRDPGGDALSYGAAGFPNSGPLVEWMHVTGSRLEPAAGLTATTVTAPFTPGTYNVRFFANYSYGLLATSATITVQ